MKSKLNLFLMMVFLIMIFSGCKKEEDIIIEDSRIVFGFAQLGDESEWRTSSSNDIKRAAEDANIQLFFENARQNQFNQIKAIRSFILNRVDVIAFSPIVEDGWDYILLEAKEAGIPVILVDRQIKTEEDDLYDAFIGSDFYKEGFDAGVWIKNKFKNKDEIIKIAEITGTEDSSPKIGRYEGLRDALKEDEKFKIVISESGDFMKSKGRECMEIILKSHPDIDILYAHNDDMALGAIEIIEEHGLKAGEDIIIVSIDAQKSGIEALKEGKINCLVECSPYIGDQLMDIVKKVVNNEEFEKITYTNDNIYTEDDDIEDLPIRP